MPSRTRLGVLLGLPLLLGCQGAERDTVDDPIPAEETARQGRVEAQADLSSPLLALSYYLQSLEGEDLHGVQRVMLDADNFQLSGPFQLDSFEVVRYDTLTAAQAAEYEFIPSPKEGDVELDVRQHVAGYGERMYTYNLREIEGAWRIYSHSMWGHDVFDEDDL